MRKVLVFILVVLGLISIAINFGYQPLVQYLNLTPKAGLRVTSTQKALVLINDKEVGGTPYQDESLKIGEYLVSLKSDEASGSGKVFWQGHAKLFEGTLTVINREINEDPAASSGETITLEKGRGVTIVSNPSGAQVTIDEKVAGTTPLFVPDVGAGQHQFVVGRDNFLKRSIKATVVDGYNLTLTVDLAISEPDLTKLSTTQVGATQMVLVKQTPTGYLRVRNAPNLNAAEVSRIAPGTEVQLLEEIPNWNRVRLKDGKEGYVATTYVQKVVPSPKPGP